MIKTEIIGFGQKINRTVKLVELSDTLTQYRGGGGGWGVGGAVQECFFCPSYFLSPYFSKYTNDDTLNTYFKFIGPPPPPPPPQIKKTKNKSHFGAVSL